MPLVRTGSQAAVAYISLAATPPVHPGCQAVRICTTSTNRASQHSTSFHRCCELVPGVPPRRTGSSTLASEWMTTTLPRCLSPDVGEMRRPALDYFSVSALVGRTLIQLPQTVGSVLLLTGHRSSGSGGCRTQASLSEEFLAVLRLLEQSLVSWSHGHPLPPPNSHPHSP